MLFVQLIVLIQCYIIISNGTTPLSKQPEKLMAELRPGSGLKFVQRSGGLASGLRVESAARFNPLSKCVAIEHM